MRRRELIAVLTAVAIGARPGSACALGTGGLKRIGVVYQGGPYEPSIDGLRDGLKAAGLEEGRDIALLLRNAVGDVAAAEAAARALERDEKVEVIVALGTTTARAARRATAEVPIVFAIGDDPVAAGLVDALPARSRAWRARARRPGSSTFRWQRNRSPPSRGSATVCTPWPRPRQTLSFSSPTSWSPCTRRLSSRRQTRSASPPWQPMSLSSGWALLQVTGPTGVNTGAARRVTSPAFSPVAPLAIFPLKLSIGRPWRSISTRPKRSASRSRPPSSSAQTR